MLFSKLMLMLQMLLYVEGTVVSISLNAIDIFSYTVDFDGLVLIEQNVLETTLSSQFMYTLDEHNFSPNFKGTVKLIVDFSEKDTFIIINKQRGFLFSFNLTPKMFKIQLNFFAGNRKR